MQTSLDQTWKDWITLNFSRGCDKHEIIQILLDRAFAPVDIIEALKNYPDAEFLIGIVNQKTFLPYGIQPQQHAYAKASEQKIQEIENARLIDSIDLPFAIKVNTDKANFYIAENFLSNTECEALIALIKTSCKPSTLTNPDEPDKAFRTSQTCDLGLLEGNALVNSIDQRIADYMSHETARAETIQGQYYQVGQQFKTHTDYFEPNTAEYIKFAADMGQRTWTFMIYLNAVALGGETCFPELGLALTPVVGRAVIWNSLLPNGEVNPATAHCAKPVLTGEKFVITKWFRTYGKLRKNLKLPVR